VIYGALATGCLYPYAVIDGMTLAEAGEVFAYWAENPPVHLMVQTIARMLGWKPPEKTPLSFSDVVAMAPPGITIAADGRLGMRSPVLDIEALRRRNHARLANNHNRR
jgi:hypothetical protein